MNVICHLCDKVFAQMSHQISHQKIQTGVKEFNCDQCKKVFKQGYHFIRHKKKKRFVLVRGNLNVTSVKSIYIKGFVLV